ncbi:hypothetical protein BC829DRAFT_432500 [Chytridium lagenaria]|nr:hypothetical protein BC829DRAFT_432500 [Chytridium lagenaria]
MGSGKVDYDVGDVSLLRRARELGERVGGREGRLDFLVVTAGIMKMQGRVETEEGVDEKMATNYYGRMELISSLMPLLEKTAKLPNADVRVLNVLSSCIGQMPPDLNDLDLKKTFSMKNCHDATTFYSDLAAESLSLLHPTVSFIHAHPGVVNTNIFRDLHPALRVAAKLLAPLLTSANDAGDAMTYLLVNETFRGGWSLANHRGMKLDKLKMHTEEYREMVWRHTEDMRRVAGMA